MFRSTYILILLTLAAMPICGRAETASSPTAEPMTENPLLKESKLDFHYPPFDKIKEEHFFPAYEQGIAEQLKEIEPIASRAEAPTFENTIVALEKTGELLGRVDRIFSNLTSANTNPQLQKIESEMAPKLSAHQDAIFLNGPLFKRIETIYNNRDKLGLDEEDKWLVERYYKDFVRAGARLSDADKARLKKMNAEIAELETTFSQNVLKEKNAASVVVDSKTELDGLSPNELAAATAAAREEKKEGKFVFPLQNTTQQPILTSLKNRALRAKIMQVSLGRNSHGTEWDNRQLVIKIARLRAERAALLGYASHAAYQLEDQTAKNVENVNKLLAQLAPPAVANARKEAAEMQKVIDQEQAGFQLASWDWAYYSEKVRQQRYSFEESEVKPYFELNHVLLDGVFYAATQLYGITFKERQDLPVYNPDVRVFEVNDKDGSPLALFLGDFYARPSKRGGAWMNEYVEQSKLLGMKPVVANHLNIPKPEAGQPTLLTYDEVRTMFHEFGHALHGMFSNVKYPRFTGTHVPRDFVEYPSQVNEMWAVWPQVLQHYARHYETGKPMPKDLLDKVIQAAEKFDQGFKTTEYLAAALLDQAWYQLKPSEVPDDALAFEANALKKAGVAFDPVPPRYRTTYFSHAFAGGYSAGYYSYIWSEQLDADSVEWLKEHGGLKRENGDHFRETLLSRGGSNEAMKLFHNFTGRDPWIEPLLKRRGLEQPAEPKAHSEDQPPEQ